jgi:serine protease Do
MRRAAAVCLSTYVASVAAMTPAQIAERATPAVVLIKIADGVGSGFIVDQRGYVATNLHVIRGATEATVVLADGREFKDVQVLAVDDKHDLALIGIAATDLAVLSLGDSTKVKPGEHVVAIGHPLGLGNTVSDGLVSAVREIDPQLTVLQISAPISPGSSGGPLFNDAGEVIGISTSIASRGQNLNFGMPANALKPLLAAAKPVPIAEFTAKNSYHRAVPTHPVSLLDGCPTARQRDIVKAVSDAIALGLPLYNNGNFEACYRIYSSTALDLDSTLNGCAGPKRALLDGVQNADKVTEWNDKAWAMRDAFDGVLDVIGRSAGRTEKASRPSAPVRSVPTHALSLLDNCDAESIDKIVSGIGNAIDSGAPLYNQGNIQACYRIYAGAIRDLDRSVQSCPAVKQALQKGLKNAGDRSGWDAKAWALRDSFDGVLEVIERQHAEATANKTK